MPPVVVAIGLAVGASAASAAVVGTIVLVSAIIMVASIAYSLVSMFGMKTPGGYSGGARSLRDRTQTVRSAVEPRRYIYGEVMTSGPLVFTHSTGGNNDFLYLVIVLAGHQVEAIGDVYIGDKLSTDSKFQTSVPEVGHWETWIVTAEEQGYWITDENDNSVYVIDVPEQGYWRRDSSKNSGIFEAPQRYVVDSPATTRSFVTITKYLGSPDQQADPELVAASGGIWTSAHRLRGCAYIVVKLEYNSGAFPNGLPNIKAVVRGNNQIYDPRTGQTGYTTNWALCIRDYLIKPYGIGCLPAEINEAQAIAAANICDEPMQLATGGTERRYTCNGSFTCDGKPLEIMKKLLTGAVGTVVWAQGEYHIYPAAYRTPETYVLTEDDLAGPLGVQPGKSTRDKFNTVTGTFADPTDYWQPVDFPPVKNSTAITAAGRELPHDVELLYTTSRATAQRLAKIHLEKELQEIIVTFPGKLTLFGIMPMDVVRLSISNMGWSEKEFRVTKWEMSDKGIINLVLREESAASYQWNSGMETVIDPAPNTQLPSPWQTPPPVNLSATEKLYPSGGDFKCQVTFAWQSTSADAVYFEYQVSDDGGATWRNGGMTTDTSATFGDEPVGAKIYRVRAVNGIGAVSAWATLAIYIYGKTAPPADITQIWASTTLTGALRLDWQPVPDVDIDYYHVRYSTVTVSAIWQTSVNVATAYSSTITLPAAKDGAYMIKAVDTSGNYSANAALVITNIPSLTTFNAIEVLTEQPAWSGTKTGCYSVNGKLYLDMAGRWNDITDFDALSNIDNYGGALAEAHYTSATEIDLGDVRTSRCTSAVQFDGIDTTALFDNITNFDAKTSFADTVDKTGVQPQISLSQDGVTWGAWQPLFVGDYTARKMRFRLQLYSHDATQYPTIDSLVYSVDMPDRSLTIDDVSIPAAGVVLPFTPAFITAPTVRGSVQTAASGDTLVISDVTAQGCTVQILNNNNGVARVVDVEARGY